jgi:hypothetical protein
MVHWDVPNEEVKTLKRKMKALSLEERIEPSKKKKVKVEQVSESYP